MQDVEPIAKPRGLYLAGTGANVGKTTVGRALAAALVRRGSAVAVMKPVETGCALRRTSRPLSVGGIRGEVDPEGVAALARLEAAAGPPPANLSGPTPKASLRPADAEALAAAAGFEAPLDRVNPYRYAPELEPAVAARCYGEAIELELITRCYHQLAATPGVELVLVEGTSGLLAPLTPELQMEHLVLELDLSVLLVVPSAPGAINDRLLNVQLLCSRGIQLAGVVLNRLRAGVAPEEAANPYQIERFSGDVVRGVLPYLDAGALAELDHLARRFEAHVDVDAILASLEPPPGSWEI